jgi:cellulose synthase/poly-beta-1,6-N-acetylglucosamine synthase-like glycosyltransferase
MSGQAQAPEQELPFVSVIIPMFNEEKSAEKCLGSILDQDYPADRMEILVIDGDSTDRSPAILASMQEHHPNLRVIHNPRRLTVTSLNLGLAEARGEIYVRMDSHSHMESDYVRACVETLRRTGADNVGGLMRAVGVTPQGEAIALATSSRFGVGGARFHYAEEEQYVDTVYLGCYRMDTIRQLGGYDESMIIDEDDELNFRLTRRGGKVFLSPRIRSWYECRSSFRALWKQYFRYGKWKVRLLQKHGRLPSLRHLVPGAFTATLLGALLLWPLAPLGGWILVATLAPYLLVNLLASVALAAAGGWKHLPLLPLTFLVLHLAYGTGFLVGLVNFLLLRRRT